MTVAEFIKPGDALLYGPKGFYGFLISIKTIHECAHCEGYIGGGKSVASRDKIGVGTYDLRADRLINVLRPVLPFNMDAAMFKYEHEYRGQGYDWWGLLRFAWRAEISATRFNNKQFCSEFLTRWYRAGGLDPFNGDDADAIAPADFLKSIAFKKYEVAINGEVKAQDEEEVL